jgi:small subunit ribosomal protein S17
MADEETTDTPAPEDTSSPEAGGVPESEGDATAPDATASDADVTPDAAPAETPEPEAAAAPEPEAAAATPHAAPAEVLAPKERRRRARAAKAAAEPTRPERSPEERQAERVAQRRQKAAVRRAYRGRAREKAKAKQGEARETPAREREPGKLKTRQGVVVSDKAAKTITVRIDMTRRHRRYEKIVRTSRTLHAHDENGDAGVGDTVVVRESRPLSRTKRWRLVRVVEKAE